MKTLGQIGHEACAKALGYDDFEARDEQFQAAWEVAAKAVVAAHEARRWRPIGEFGDVQIQGTVGRWMDGEWETAEGFLSLSYWAAHGWTHVLTPAPAPAPPKEAE